MRVFRVIDADGAQTLMPRCIDQPSGLHLDIRPGRFVGTAERNTPSMFERIEQS
jgi:hypothetical protein